MTFETKCALLDKRLHTLHVRIEAYVSKILIRLEHLNIQRTHRVTVDIRDEAFLDCCLFTGSQLETVLFDLWFHSKYDVYDVTKEYIYVDKPDVFRTFS